MTTDETPTPGPELDSVYQPGNPGAPWTKGEVVLMMMVNHDDADDNDGADDDADDNDGADNDADDNDGADDHDDDDDDGGGHDHEHKEEDTDTHDLMKVMLVIFRHSSFLR